MKEHASPGSALFAMGVLGFLSAMVASGARPSAPRYTFTNLGTPGQGAFNLHGFNNDGKIVGEAIPDGASAFKGFVWQAGKVTWLPSLGGERSFGAAINNKGQIVGTAESATGIDAMGAVEWKDGKPVPLGFVPRFTSALAINEARQVVGTSGDQAFLWDRGKVTSLGHLPLPSPLTSTQATAINNNWQIVGGTNYGYCPTGMTPEARANMPQAHAWIWEVGKMKDLGVGEALAINDRGQVLIQSRTGGRIWQNGRITQLEGLPGFPHCLCRSMNSQGQIVGAAATEDMKHARNVVWQDGKAVDLMDALPPGTDIGLLYINDRGQVVGRGMMDGHPSVCLLTPQRAKE